MRRVRFAWLIATLVAAGLLAATEARAQEASDQKSLELSEQLLDLAGVKVMVTQLLDQVTPGLTRLVQQANPGKEAAVNEVMTGFIWPKMKERLPEMIHEGAIMYTKHFTIDELTQLVSFYQSPVGRKLVREQPAMSLELGHIGQAWAQAVAVQAIQQYSDEFKKRGLQTPI
jgi:hypothetical protein